jgi:hypothetical protein
LIRFISQSFDEADDSKQKKYARLVHSQHRLTKFTALIRRKGYAAKNGCFLRAAELKGS